MIFYVHPNTVAGPDSDSIHINSTECHADRPWREYTQPLTVIGETAWGDYANGTVERSNQRVMLADADMVPVLVRLIGSYGWQALGFLGTEVPECLVEAFERLARYSVLDEDDLSSLESELELEAWNDWGRKDFIRELAKWAEQTELELADGVDLDGDWNNEVVDRVWRRGVDEFNINGGSGVNFETGCSVYFYTDEWMKRFSNSPGEILVSHDGTAIASSIAEMFELMCQSTPTSEEESK